MITLFAHPYNTHAQGFYFETTAEYNTKASQSFDSFGTPIEELEATENLAEYEKIDQIAMGECRYAIDENTDTGNVELYCCETLEELALHFVQKGNSVPSWKVSQPISTMRR